MKSFFEKLKDILYDGIDYIMMIVVIVVVALVINWRLGGLFAKDAIDTLPESSSNVTNADHASSNEEKPKDNNDSEKSLEETTDENDNLDDQKSDTTVKINIPAGSLPSKIGDILESNGLVNDKNEFVQKAIDLKVETKLKYGEFEIAKNSSIEDILKILTK